MLNYFKKYDELQSFVKQCVNQVCDGIMPVILLQIKPDAFQAHVHSLGYVCFIAV